MGQAEKSGASNAVGQTPRFTCRPSITPVDLDDPTASMMK
jgi:hypothetical protein